MAPEDNPADDEQPTEDEWEAYLQQPPTRGDDDTEEWPAPDPDGGEA